MAQDPALDERLRRLSDAARESERCAQDDRDARDDVIEEADLAGYAARRIARITGLSHTQVVRIANERLARRQEAGE